MTESGDETDFEMLTVTESPTLQRDGNGNEKWTFDKTREDPPASFPNEILSFRDLQVLKIFTDNFSIPERLGTLGKLEILMLRRKNDVGQEICKIPQSLSNLKQLRKLDLRNNHLATFPEQLTRLQSLEKLDISNCQLVGLPECFYNLRNLKTLTLSHNALRCLPSCVTKLVELRELHVDNNCLQSVCVEICNLVKLEGLNLSKNKLTSVPAELFNLVNLTKLRLNGNMLELLPENLGNLESLNCLILRQNILKRLPKSVENLKKLQYLDLNGNLLSGLPPSITNVQKLDVGGNPLQVPPVHVCNSIESICGYFNAKQNTRTIHSKRLKAVFLGKSMAGKTCLVKMLMEGESNHIEEDDRTDGVVFHHWKPEPHFDELEFLVVDCSGQKNYQMMQQLFLSQASLFILVVNLARYKINCDKSYWEEVGQWIYLVTSRIPGARILLVPTHLDQCQNEGDINKRCCDILKNMKEQRDKMASELDKNGKEFEEGHETVKDNLPVLSLQYKDIHKDTCNELSMNVVVISNLSLEGTQELRNELVRIARDKNLSPIVDTMLQDSWVNIENAIKQLRKSLDVPYSSLNELRVHLKDLDIDVDENELQCCITYLDAIGEVYYFKDIDGLDKNVVLCPHWFASLLKRIFTRAMCTNIEYDDNMTKFNVAKIIFVQDKKFLLDKCVMSQRLLKCFWSEFMLPADIVSQLVMILTYFDIFREIPSVLEELTAEDVTDSGQGASKNYLLPWLLKEGRPQSFDKYWPQNAPSNMMEVTVGFALVRHLPSDVFNTFSVLCHNHVPDDHQQWVNGFYMKFQHVRILCDVISMKKSDSLQLTARARKVETKVETLWRTLLLLLEEAQNLLKERITTKVATYTVCPKCVKLGLSPPYHFRCDWFKACQTGKSVLTCPNMDDDESHEVKADYLFPSNAILERLQTEVDADTIPDCILPLDLLDDIAKGLGTNWKQLARRLGCGKKVDSIKSDNLGQTHEQAVKMLKSWKGKMGENAKIKIIIEKLREMELNDVADETIRRCRKKPV